MVIYSLENFSEEKNNEVVEKIIYGLKNNKWNIVETVILSDGTNVFVNWSGDDTIFISTNRDYNDSYNNLFWYWVEDYAKDNNIEYEELNEVTENIDIIFDDPDFEI